MTTKPLLAHTDSLQLFPLAYPWAWEMYLENMDNHWTPREISVAADVALWKSNRLSEAERHLFLSVMAQLTTFDVQRGDETAEALQGLLDPPEIKHYLKRLADEEALHCYAQGTEVLTARGWIDFRSLMDGDRIAQWLNGEISFVPHLGVVKDCHKGEMVSFSNQDLHSVVTPNHWCVAQSVEGGEFVRVPAKDFSPEHYLLPVAGLTTANGPGLSDFDRLRIAFQAHGSYGKTELGYLISLGEQQKVERLEEILTSCKMPYAKSKYINLTKIRFSAQSHLTRSFEWIDLPSVSVEWCRAFIEEIILWWRPIPTPSGLRYQAPSAGAADTALAVAALGGWQARVTKIGRSRLFAFVDQPTIQGQSLKKSKVPYHGCVYSVGVPSRTLVVRYQDSVLVSGNTWSYQFIIENMGLDQNDIYTRYARVPEMKARVDLAGELSMRAKQVLARRLRHPGDPLTLRDRQEVLFAMIFWFLGFEGVWFIMGLSGPIQNLARQGRFSGAAEQFQYILRDETQHIRFGTQLIQEYLGQYPECLTTSFRRAILRLFEETIRLEEAYIRHCLPEPLVGYSAEDHVETARWYADLRLKSIGLDPLFGAEHRFPWMDEMVRLRKEKNFFETRPTEYRTGGALRWED